VYPTLRKDVVSCGWPWHMRGRTLKVGGVVFSPDWCSDTKTGAVDENIRFRARDEHGSMTRFDWWSGSILLKEIVGWMGGDAVFVSELQNQC